jgi:hypothetical protein
LGIETTTIESPYYDTRLYISIATAYKKRAIENKQGREHLFSTHDFFCP